MTSSLSNWIDLFFDQHPQLRADADLIIAPPMLSEVAERYPEAANEPDLIRGETLFVRGKHDSQGHGLTVLALYYKCRQAGTSHEMSMMLALQRPPGVNTNDTFWAGRKRFDQVYGELYANRIRHLLSERGVRLGEQTEYMPELARFPGDPEAVVPFGGARDHIRKLCQQRGWGCDGAVKVEAAEPLTDPFEKKQTLAPDLVERQRQVYSRRDRDFANKSVAEQREIVLDKHGPPK
jgi:hypothetical protein